MKNLRKNKNLGKNNNFISRRKMMLKKCFLPKYLGNFHRHFQTSSIVCKEKRWKEKSVLPFQSELKNPVAEVYGGIEHWPADKVKKCLKFRNNLSFSILLKPNSPSLNGQTVR